MMNREILSLKYDVIFKMFFVRHQTLLKSFVSAILDIPLDSIRELMVTNPELPPANKTAKGVRLDICLELNNQVIDIEIQVHKYHNFKDRILFYWAKLFTSMLESGEDYGMLKPAIAVSVVDFSLFPAFPDYQTDVVPVIEGTQTVYSDKMRLRFFELQKLCLENDSLSQCDLKYLWLYLFNAKTTKDLDMLRDTQHPDIVMACDMLQSLSEEEKAWNALWAREQELHDIASLIADGRKEDWEDGRKEGWEDGRKDGREEGWEDGRNAERKNILNKLRMRGVSEEVIAEIMSMPDEYKA